MISVCSDMNKNRIRKIAIVLCFKLILSSFYLNSQSTNGRIIYSVKHNFDYLDTNQKNNVSKILNPTFDAIDDLKYELIWNRYERLFVLIDALEIPENEANRKMAANLVSKGAYYLNTRTNEKINSLSLLGEDFIIKYPIIKNNWVISKETRVIIGFKCFKGSLLIPKDKMYEKDRLVEAWFTPEIPISIGPKNFNGLPGLILELKEDRIKFVANSINFQYKPEIKKPSKGIAMTEGEFNDLIIKKSKEMGFIKK